MKLPKDTNYCLNSDNNIYVIAEPIEIYTPDSVKTLHETPVGIEGMRIDREFFAKASEEIQKDEDIKTAVEKEQWDVAIAIIRSRYEDRPELYLNLEKIRKNEKLDRRLSWREFLERVFGKIDHFKTKDEKLQDECNKFISIYKPASNYVMPIINYFKAYITDSEIRDIIESRQYARLATNAKLNMNDLQELNGWRDTISVYIKDYVSLNQFMN
ncbi:MAG: hypothetical protein LBV69_00305 [Bacteroidales bacterium]|nr:hypothetical protein [Bacteroidales bacterium]